jgi:hypothetical protein
LTEIATTEPTKIQAGDRLRWRREDLSEDYPAGSGWSLSYAFVKSGALIEITASADGDFFDIDEDSATTAAWSAGVYAWQGYVTSSGGERTKIDEGTLEVLTDFAAQSTGYDDRSYAAKIVEACDIYLAENIAGGQQSYTIGERSVTFMSRRDALETRAYYNNILTAERNAEKIANGQLVGRLRVKFTE